MGKAALRPSDLPVRQPNYCVVINTLILMVLWQRSAEYLYIVIGYL